MVWPYRKVWAERCSEAPRSGHPWGCAGDSWPKQGDLEEALVPHGVLTKVCVGGVPFFLARPQREDSSHGF